MATALRPGSFTWLVRHELRLAIRDGGGAGRRARTIALLVLMAVPLLIGVTVAITLRDAPAVPEASLSGVTAAVAALFFILLSGACVYVLRSFHDRADLDLLLAAPIPPERVLAAKSVAILASVVLPMLVLTAPFVVTSAIVGHPGWLGGSAMIVIAGGFATALGFVVAGLLFRAVGPRRARVMIQIGSGGFAAFVAFLGQTPTFAPKLFERLTGSAVPPPTPLDWPARAVFGAPLPLLALTALAALAMSWATRMAARGVAEISSAAAVPVSAARPARAFKSGLARILLVKELRLLWRDPELLAAIALQFAYMIPAFGLIFAGGIVSPGRLAAGMVLFAGLLPSSLAWLTICGEEAPELLAAAPVPVEAVIRAKLIAACLPALVVALVPLTLIALSEARAALIVMPFCLAAALGAAIQQFWIGKPQPRRAFRRRQRGSMLLAISEYVMAGGWSVAAGMSVSGSQWALVPALLATAVLLVSRNKAAQAVLA